jgi:hypothetical protein
MSSDTASNARAASETLGTPVKSPPPMMFDLILDVISAWKSVLEKTVP